MKSFEEPVRIELARERDFDLGAVRVLPSTREVAAESGTVLLETRVMEVLVALARRRGSVVSRADLAHECWSGRAVGDDAINRCIQALRRLSGTHGGFSIRTVKRVGYRLDEDAPATRTAGATLAVLPFDNLSGDPDLAWFSDGLSVEILQTVAQAADLKVVGHGSSFQFRGPAKAARRVGAELGVSHVLDGSVRRAGARLRISASLVETGQGVALWSQTFERDLADAFVVQDEIAGAVAAALRLAFSPARPSEAVDPAVYDLYLQARNPMGALAGSADEAQQARALRFMEEVTEAAPGFARAWADLAMRRVVCLRRFDRDRFPGLTPAAAIEAAETALRLDPGLGVAHQALSYLAPFAAYAEREALHRRALATAPNDPEVLNLAGQFFAEVGRLGEALSYARAALALDPLYWPAAHWYAGLLGAVGRHDETPALWDAYLARWPDIEALAGEALAAAAAAGTWDRFERLARAAAGRGFDDARFAAFVEALRSRRGPDPEALAALRGRISADVAREGRAPLGDLARLHAQGGVEEVFAIIEQCSFPHLFESGGRMIAGAWAPAVIFLDANRAMVRDRRFVRLCARLGLVKYWVETDRWPDCADDPALPYDFRSECRALSVASGGHESPPRW